MPPRGGMCPGHGRAGLLLPPGLWSVGAARQPRRCRGDCCAGSPLRQRARLCPCGTRALPRPRRRWSCVESRGPHCTVRGAAGTRKMMLLRMSGSKNTSKPVLMAASKQERKERQTRLLATVEGEKQFALQAGEGLLPSQLQSRREMWQMSQMSQKGLGPPVPNAAGCVTVGG